MNNILRTDSYKLGHWQQYPEGTEGIYSYLEAREGAEHPETVFFGLQPILRSLAGRAVTVGDIHDADELAKAHFGTDTLFNKRGWEHITRNHHGRLPVRIKAVPEGTPVPVGNVLMTVENTDPACFWLTNALESVLMHVWYPTTVATVSREVKRMLKGHLDMSADSDAGLPFMLHDFGYRGVSSDESAEMGGMGHLVNFLGTDTLPAMLAAKREYGADFADLAFSVPATEHSVMTSRGRSGEFDIVANLIEKHPTGILSVVADSFDIYGFVETLGTLFHGRIMARDGKFVVRPDSITKNHGTPEGLTAALLEQLWSYFGGTTNSKGYRVLDPHIGLLWGDGIDPKGIDAICAEAIYRGFSAENLVFGMGGGLLQKVNRDTERFAFKASAIKQNGRWQDVQKQPLDASKLSKKGRMALVRGAKGLATVSERVMGWNPEDDLLQTVFENGSVTDPTTFAAVRERAAL
jgi:nicotinamide phosphoribosyltransferase